MRRLGLTGSIGMGKTTTAGLFAQAGVPTYDADSAVHALYRKGGAAVRPIEDAFPGVVVDGSVDRSLLSTRVLDDAAAMKRLEAIVHPLVGQDRLQFLQGAAAKGADLVLLDVPLLFETGGDRAVDVVVVASCDPEQQRARVLARPGMTEEKFQAILKRQTPDQEKRASADFVIDTSRGVEAARRQVETVIAAVRTPGWRSVRPGR